MIKTNFNDDNIIIKSCGMFLKKAPRIGERPLNPKSFEVLDEKVREL